MKFLCATLVALVLCENVMAQNQLSGTVTDQQGEPLPSANVYLKETNKATATDLDGKFALKSVQSGTYTLVVSYVGFEKWEKEMEITSDKMIDISLSESVIKGQAVMVYATRANENTPTTFSNISRKEIEERNLGQDMPFILRFTPSVVVTSDAGNGVGYTGMRIRGSDPTRINVTVNGIPLNDSESHGVFWVNMPDFASSVDNIQIQRGVGTSTNGAAAFGATVNLKTDMPNTEPEGRIDNSFGSFNTWRHSVEFGTGLIKDRWSFEGRLSKISSDGYIDRASSDLRSYYLSGGYYGDKTTIKAITFAGKEVTYQSWWGTPEARLENDEEGMREVIANNGYTDEQAENLLTSGRTFNYYLYENEVDNYQQDHYQLHFNHAFDEVWNVNAALHYTYGRGYFEQYRIDDDFADYNLPPVTLGATAITSTDLIRRRWLDNDFYGITFSGRYTKNKWDVVLGGAWNRYDGDHFGEIIWAQFASTSEIRERYYDNVGEKTDFNTYLKANYQLNDRLNLFVDGQVRSVDYRTVGIDNDLRAIDAGDTYLFFNPKAGATYTLNSTSNIYASFAVGNREPVRNDFIDAPDGQVPQPETLRNLEVGYRKQEKNYSFNVNYYLMDYENQLVLTGALNDVGSSVRVNVPDSYRTGIEFVGGVRLSKAIQWQANLTLSQNKIENFTEIIYDYGADFSGFSVIENEYSNTDISFSPDVIAGSQLTVRPFQGMEVNLFSKYVGRQYLDNTSNEDRSIDPYFVNDIKADYTLTMGGIKQAVFSLMVNNVLDVMYVSNGYTFGYAGGDFRVRENYYYPQAGINFLASVSLRF